MVLKYSKVRPRLYQRASGTPELPGSSLSGPWPQEASRRYAQGTNIIILFNIDPLFSGGGGGDGFLFYALLYLDIMYMRSEQQ